MADLSSRLTARHVGGVYGRSLIAQIRAITEYPGDFWVMASAGVMWNVLQFAFLTVLFATVPDVAGWRYHEMLMLSGLLTVAAGSTALLCDGVWSTGQMVLKGEIDYRMTRPAPVVVQVATTHIGMQGFGEVGFGLVMAAYGWIGAGMGLAALPVGVLGVACAIVIECALITALCAVNFWIKGPMSNFAFVLIDLQHNAMTMPLGLFPVAVKIVTMTVVPVAFVNFVPVAVLTGHLSAAWLVGPPLAAAASVLAALGVYRLGLRSYDSSGH
ncbi:ABC-2 family transporter protein [Glycomyces endophyticus]|uniref:ABC-2 family transporter protein n=1 Tax=Glycomyces endophyticus TaxID=480996 RepID=A0ABP4S501_9ACTN